MHLLPRTALVLLLAALSFLPTAARPRAAIAVNPLLAQPYTLTFRVRKAGTITIPAASLAAMGWPIATLDPRSIQVFRRGVETPIHVHGEVDGRFDPQDSIQFVVYPSERRYTTE